MSNLAFCCLEAFVPLQLSYFQAFVTVFSGVYSTPELINFQVWDVGAELDFDLVASMLEIFDLLQELYHLVEVLLSL